jgi:transposase
VALSYGLNTNLVHRWRRNANAEVRGRPAQRELAEFVPVALASAPVIPAPDDIRIELRRGACSVTVAWPTSAAGECAAWLRDLVR